MKQVVPLENTLQIIILQVQEFNRIVEKFKENVDFLFVYVAEAHASDEWAAGAFKVLAQHRNQTERIDAAKSFIEMSKLKCNLVTDLMTNVTAKMYGARVERLYIVRDSVIFYQGGPGPHKYDIKEFETKLSKLF